MQNDFAIVCDEDSNRDDLAQAAEWRFLPNRFNRTPRLRANRPCGFLLALALEATTYFEATLLKGTKLQYAGFRVRNFAATFRDHTLFFKLSRLARDVENLYTTSTDGYAIIYRVDKMKGIQDVQAISQTLREELTHWKQNYFGNGQAASLIIAQDIVQHPLWPRIRLALLSRHYHDDPALLVAESTAKAAAGAFADIGLNAYEGRDFLAFYFGRLLDRYGYQTAIQILQFVDRSQVLRLHAIGKTYTPAKP